MLKTHLHKLQRALDQILEAHHEILLRNDNNEGFLVNRTKIIVATCKAFETSYLDEKAQGMLLVAFV